MEQMNLYDLIKFYGRKWRVIVALTVAGLLAGLAYNMFIQVPLYQSNSKLILVSSPTTATATNQTLINNYIDLITSRRVLEPVIEKQGGSVSYEKLLTQVKAVNQKDTAVIDVTVTTTDAQQSADIANEITDSFKKAVSNLYQTSGVIVVDPAVKPAGPNNVHTVLQLIVTTGAGFILSLVSLFFVYDYAAARTNKPAAKKTVKKPVKKTTKSVKKSSNTPIVKSKNTKSKKI